MRLAVVLCASVAGNSIYAQASNLLKNANGEDELRSWVVMGNAAVTDCYPGAKCFAISQDAFIYQDVGVPEGTSNSFALLIGFTSIEEPNASAKQLGKPYLFGYFMSAGDLRTAKLIAKLSGQEMSKIPGSSGEWVTQFGVFKLAESTRRIRIFLRSGCAKSDPSIICTSHFRKPGIFLFNSEEEARAFVNGYQ